MAELVYILCALTSFACAALLLRGYRKGRTTFLLWSSLCFIAFALNNVILIIDLMVVPTIDLFALRTIVMLVGFALLIYGFVWEKA